MRALKLPLVVVFAALVLVGPRLGTAAVKDGHLVIHAYPKQAYVYADGEPIVESLGHFITLSPGEHKIDLYNYGYKPVSRNVTLTSHKTLHLNVTMEPIPGIVSGPWGCITLEGAPRAAVLLNGTEPATFFVGHGDEFNNNWIWKQELVVPPGKHQLTVEYLNQKRWTTTVDVQANKRVVVDAYKGVRKTVDWPSGERMKEEPQFRGGIASTRVVVQKVSGEFSASTGQVNCGDTAHLTWSAKGAEKIDLNGQPVGAAGDQTVKPTQTTTYKFTAAGPGGVYTSDATVNVNTAIPASLTVSPKGTGQPDSANVTWSAPNADSVSLEPLGAVGETGSREIHIVPAKTSAGEDVTYTLHASNACGGNETRTATLHIPSAPNVLQGTAPGAASEATLQTKLTLNSVYFPTDWPTVKEPDAGLVPSQEHRVEGNASDFKKYEGYRSDAKLILEAYCDVRGSVAYNQKLAERRGNRVKNYLVEHGIPAEKIEVKAYGKTRRLSSDQVKALTAENPNLTPEQRRRVLHEPVVFQWANNRRVDIRLSTTGEVSKRFYPLNSADLNLLLGTKEPAARQTASLK